VSCLLRSTQGWDLKEFSPGERDKLRNGGPHVTEGVRCTLARFSSVMYGIVLGVTPPGALHKMNQDNDCLFNANLINEWMNEYDYVWYDMIMIMIWS
jgi:hypothetical protein